VTQTTGITVHCKLVYKQFQTHNTQTEPKPLTAASAVSTPALAVAIPAQMPNSLAEAGCEVALLT